MLNKAILIDKETLNDMYINKEMPMKKIADILNVSITSVFNYLNKYNIPTRDWKTNFNMKGKKQSAYAIKRISEVHKNKHLSDKTKHKISLSHKGVFTNPSEYGGHEKIRSDGYISVYLPEHPYSSNDGYVMKHHLVMEKYIGKYIENGFVVHHINHIRDDNQIENLQLMTFKEHAGLHMTERHKNIKENK